MDDHLKRYNKLFLEAIDAGCDVANGELANQTRIAWFLDTLPSDFKMMKGFYMNSAPEKQTWTELRRAYQNEMDEKDEPEENVQEVNAYKRGTQKRGEKEGKKKQREEGWLKKAECFKCGKVGHIKRECP
ncbi:hypothetical protein L204_105590 [Cryptococcus depauperatus]